MEAAFREAREEAGLEADMMTVYNDIQAVLGRIIQTIRLLEKLGPNIGIRYSFIFWVPNTIQTI